MATHVAGDADSWALDVEIRREAGDVVVHLRGELDAATVPALREVLVDLIDNQGNLGVVLELADLSFIDSTGLGLIVGARKKVADRGGRLRLRHPTAATLRVLEVTGLGRLFEIDLPR